MKLSICMMVKDEEKNLERCLKSLQPIIKMVESELIIVDTGSKDSSIEIAKKYTDKVYFHKWNNNFSEMRNITISYAKGTWILIVDADEELVNTKCIVEFLNSNEEADFKSASFKAVNYMDFYFEDKTYFTTLRLFRNNGVFKYEGVVHNVPTYELPTKFFDDLLIKHYGYNIQDRELVEKKFQRTATLLKSELVKNPKNLYYKYQLSVSYLQHEDIKESLEEAVKAYNQLIEDNLNKREYLYIYYQLAVTNFKNGKYRASEIACKEGITVCDDYMDLWFCMAQAQKLLGDYENAVTSYNKYFNLLNNYHNLKISKDTSIGTYSMENKDDAYYGMAQIYFVKEDYDSALTNLLKMNKMFNFKESIKILIYSYIKLNNYEELKNIYLEHICKDNAELKNNFEIILEEKIKTIDGKEKLKLIKLFSSIENNYGILNFIRINLEENTDELFKKLDYFIERYNLNECPSFYGEIIYISFKLNRGSNEILNILYEDNINRFFQYLSENYKDFKDMVLSYLNNLEIKNENIIIVKTKIILYRYVLITSTQEENYEKYFLKYIKYGIEYIKTIYNDEILKMESKLLLRNAEELFFVFIEKAFKYRNKDNLKYIEYLKKALNEYPIMKNGIKLLSREIKNENIEKNSEFEIYKKEVKNTIKKLIDSNEVNQAEAIIKEYESIVKGDIEILLFKSQIAVLKIKSE